MFKRPKMFGYGSLPKYEENGTNSAPAMTHEKGQDASNLQVKNGKGDKVPQYVAAIAACMGSVALGSVLGWTGNISEDMKSLTYNGIEIDDNSLGWIGSLSNLGFMVSCLPVGKLCDILGRKMTMLLLTVPFVIGWLLVIFATSLATLYVGRFVTGFAGGAFCVSAPIYATEIAQKEIRGALGSYADLFLTVGILYAYATAMAVDMKTYTVMNAVLPVIFFVVFVFQPESPVFHMKRNDEEKARAALEYLRGSRYDISLEFRELKAPLVSGESQTARAEPSPPLLALLKRRAAKRAALVCFGLMFFQQATGIYPVILYTDGIFKSARSEMDPKVSVIVFGVIQALATFVGAMIVDRVGRRVLLIVSNLLVSVFIGILGLFFMLQDRQLVSEEAIGSLGWLPIASLSVYIIVFSVGMGPVPWVLSAELFSSEIRGVAGGAAATFNFFISFLLTKFYLNFKNAVGTDTTFYLFSVLSFVGTVFIYCVVPETKGKTLDEIQKELDK